MPLLPLEPFVYPEGLLGESAPTPDGEAKWWVVHARPRAEKALARKLLSEQVSFFLPLYRKDWRAGGRARTSYAPLFPGYLFLHGEDRARLAALETNQVAGLLPVPDGEGLRAELRRVYQVMQSEQALSPEERLRPGTPVRIVSGALRGLEGKVLRRGGKLRFVVEVTLLQRGVSVEVESWMIQPLDARAVRREVVARPATTSPPPGTTSSA
jgi:transcriptional antiterminator RfaH